MAEQNFDDARISTEELFDNQQLTIDDAVSQEQQEQLETEQPQDTDTDVQKQHEQSEINQQQPTNILDLAEQSVAEAAETVGEKDEQLQQVLQRVQDLELENETIKNTMTQMSDQQEQAIIGEAMEMPTIDMNRLAFEDEDTIRTIQEQYAAQMAEYVKGSMMKELAPFIEQAKEGQVQKEKEEALNALSQIPELSGIRDMIPQLDRIIANHKALSNADIPMDEKYVTAYAIAMGVNSMNTPAEQPKELTADDLMRAYEENPTFQELLEKKRLEQIKQSQQVPPFSASSGAVNAALNIKDKPKTFDEASERTRNMFGLN